MQEILSTLFRNIESELGTHDFCVLALNALKDALKQYKVMSPKESMHQWQAVFKLMQETKPRYAVLIDSFYKLWETCEDYQGKYFIKKLTQEIDRVQASYQLEKLQLVQVGQKVDLKNKNILIYDHSHSVHSVLLAMKNNGQKFTVTVAEQDIDKTADNIAFLHELDMPYKVVPAYMLSHIDDTIDAIFFGAVTFQGNYNFVMDPGSKSIISHFHLEKKPIYTFLTTSKFSLWKIDKSSFEIYAKPHRRKHHTFQDIEFDRLKFSHDRVPINLMSYVVTEKGVHTPSQLKKVFDEMFEKRKRQNRKFLQ